MFEVRTGTEILADHVGYVFEQDKEALDTYLKGRGWRYVAGAICILPLTLFKALIEFANTASWCFRKPIAEKTRTGIGLSSSEFKSMDRHIAFSDLEGYNTEGVREIQSDETIEQRKKVVNADVNGACLQLRAYLQDNNNKLEGTIIRTQFPKISSEELLESVRTGVFKRPFIVQRVTFGNDINKVLKLIFKDIKLRKVRGVDDTYIVLEGNDVLELENMLKDMFIKNVTVILRRNNDK